MKHLTYIFCFLLPIMMEAQVAPAYIELDSEESGDTTFVASDYISFLSGFSYKAVNGERLHAYIYPISDDYKSINYKSYINPATALINKSLPVGSLPGNFSVSKGGSANYSIPIELPAASVDFMPSLTLSYNSHAGNSACGIKWVLSGLFAINKVNRSNYFDGERKSIQYTKDDAIALNGQRLIKISDGGIDNIGAVYATEQEDYTRITRTVDGYVAKLKNGTTMEFGTKPTARILGAAEEKEELGWLLNKVTDIYGNFYTIHYKNFGFGEVLPDYIDYTSNATKNISAYNQIHFSYRSRSDEAHKYVNGKLIKITKLLYKIQVTSKGQMYRKYDLQYFYDGVSKLNKIQLTGIDNIKYNPTIIGWNKNNYDYEDYGLAHITDLPSNYILGDYNNDGKTDVIRYEKNYPYTDDDVWEMYLNELPSDRSGGNPFATIPFQTGQMSNEFSHIYEHKTETYELDFFNQRIWPGTFTTVVNMMSNSLALDLKPDGIQNRIFRIR
jgi:hypothetical protein